MPWWIFEGAIWFFLVLGGAALVEIVAKRGRKIFKQPTLGLSVVVLFFVWGTIFYGSFIEPRILFVRQETVFLDSFDQTIRIALLADFHIGPYKGAGWIEEIVEKTNKQKPDLILLLGDYVFGDLGRVEDLAGLKRLSAPLGVYAILGNHDYDSARQDEIKSKLEALGVKVLLDASEKIELPEGSSFCLAGVNDLWNDSEFDETLGGCLGQENILLMSHNPDAVLLEESRAADLIVAAHSHGGQIRLPFVGPVALVPTVLSKKYSKGFFSFDGVKIYITSGLGETGPRARLFNPPEIVILELK